MAMNTEETRKLMNKTKRILTEESQYFSLDEYLNRYSENSDEIDIETKIIYWVFDKPFESKKEAVLYHITTNLEKAKKENDGQAVMELENQLKHYKNTKDEFNINVR